MRRGVTLATSERATASGGDVGTAGGWVEIARGSFRPVSMRAG